MMMIVVIVAAVRAVDVFDGSRGIGGGEGGCAWGSSHGVVLRVALGDAPGGCLNGRVLAQIVESALAGTTWPVSHAAGGARVGSSPKQVAGLSDQGVPSGRAATASLLLISLCTEPTLRSSCFAIAL